MCLRNTPWELSCSASVIPVSCQLGWEPVSPSEMHRLVFPSEDTERTRTGYSTRENTRKSSVLCWNTRGPDWFEMTLSERHKTTSKPPSTSTPLSYRRDAVCVQIWWERDMDTEEETQWRHHGRDMQGKILWDEGLTVTGGHNRTVDMDSDCWSWCLCDSVGCRGYLSLLLGCCIKVSMRKYINRHNHSFFSHTDTMILT